MENPGQFTSRVQTPPTDSIAAIQLLDLFRDPDHDIDRIVEFISNDPVLAAETLRRCNNASFRGAERTTDIFEAVNRLGFYELYGIIAASTGLCPSFPDPQGRSDSEPFPASKNVFF
jgi:HD-like signal output (HDOD) protein